MAIVLGWVVWVALVGLTVMQSIYVLMYCRFLKSGVAAQLDAGFEPRAAVVLCLRGSDPSLQECLNSLSTLDYDDFEIHIVVDDELDPALETVRLFFPTENGVDAKTHVFREKTTSRSLKCSAILTALATLDETIDVVALIDADSVVDRNWLKDLVHPLADRSVGATTGNRWFAPTNAETGSVVRQLWNAAAIAQMSFYQIPWGGSLALRRSTIAECGLQEAWGNAFCEDTLLTKTLGDNGLRVVRVPDLIIANEETTSLPDAFRWIVRQLLTVRLYHREWGLVLAHAVFTGVCLSAAVISVAVSFATNNLLSAIWVLAAIVLYNVTNAILLRAISSGNENAITKRGIRIDPIKISPVVIFKGMLITQIVQPMAAITAALTRKISWRGITYTIGANRRIEMIRYQPYREMLDQREKHHDNSID